MSVNLSLMSATRISAPYEMSTLQRWPTFAEFDVVHDYLITPNNKMQARIRKRGKDSECLCVELSPRSTVSFLCTHP